MVIRRQALRWDKEDIEMFAHVQIMWPLGDNNSMACGKIICQWKGWTNGRESQRNDTVPGIKQLTVS